MNNFLDEYLAKLKLEEIIEKKELLYNNFKPYIKEEDENFIKLLINNNYELAFEYLNMLVSNSHNYRKIKDFKLSDINRV
jgi:hypothetical protein